MQDQVRHVRLNEEEVVAKLIEDEAILINLVSGVYYSMDGCGARVWSLIEAGAALETIIATLASEYDVPMPRASEDVRRLIAELLEQRLVFAADSASVTLPTDLPIAAEKRDYAAPTLNIYTDMGDLLALDPPVPGFEDISWEKRRE